MADHHDTPGEPPTIRDEAADSPMWLPALGLTLLLLGTLVIAWRSSATPAIELEGEAAEAAEAPADAADDAADDAAEDNTDDDSPR